MLNAMHLFLDSFWRAAADCLRPRVIALSILPLVLMVALSLTLGYFYWDTALEGVRTALDGSSLVTTLAQWLQTIGADGLKTVLAPIIVVFAVTPVIVLLSLLAVALLVSVPLWLIPPLILVLPPLIWGWLTYRVMAFDALAEHASRPERLEILRRHRPWLLGIGVFTGYLGAAPSLLWASGALFIVAFVVLVPIAIWVYTLVFAFSSLWFAHYSLAALQQLRDEAAGPDAPPGREPKALGHDRPGP